MEKLLKEFAELLERQQIERLKADKLDCQCNIDNYKVSIKAGKKYYKVDLGYSGRFMIDMEGNIFGIKAYGVIHRGHRYGTLLTVNQWDWSGYYPKRTEQKPVATISMENSKAIN